MENKSIVHGYDKSLRSDEEIVQCLIEAAAEAGMSNSGLVINPLGGIHRADLLYWQGVVIARLQGLTPPFLPGQNVVAKQDTMGKHDDAPLIKKGETHTINRIFWDHKTQRWMIQCLVVSANGRVKFVLNKF